MALLTTSTVTKPSLILPSSFPSCNSTSSSTSTSNSSSCIRFQHQTHNISCLYLGASSRGFRRNPITIVPGTRYKVWKRHVVCMAPEEERMTRRSPLDFPIEWERPRPARRPDIFPQFSPMKTPLPIPMPADPPEEEEEEEEKKEEEEDPDKEEDPEPEKQS